MARPARILSAGEDQAACERLKEVLAVTGVACEIRSVSSLEELDGAMTAGDPDLILMGGDDRGGGLSLEVLRKKLPASLLVVAPAQPDEDWAKATRWALLGLLDGERSSRAREALEQIKEEARELEVKYRSLLEGVNDAVLILRGDVVVDCNGAASSMFQCGRELMVNNSYVSLVPPTQPGGVSSVLRLRKLIDRATQGRPQQTRLLHRRYVGAPFFAEFNLRSMRLTDRSYLLAVVRDVTGQEKAEEAKTQLETRLRQAQKMESMGTLAGGIAHDFNNILGAILGYTHLAKQDAEHLPEVMESLGAVEKASKRARDLVKQILAFSRHEEPERKSIRLQDVLKEAVNFIRASLPTTVAIEVDIDPNTGPVMADPTQIHQVVLNLAANAAHAMNQQGILRIGLKGVRVDAALTAAYPELVPGDHARLTLSDTGCGMDRETQERIFDPFFTTKGPGEGTGLGLAVVHGIVKNHEGVVTLQSAVGKGSTFRIYLPVRGQGGECLPVDTVQTGRGVGQRILFVDDEVSLAKVGKKLLERVGYSVTVCCDSVEAVELFRAKPFDFDLVITDQTMPKLEGAEMSRRMMEIRPDIPIILTTGYTSRVTPEQSREMGIREMLLKPLSGAALANAAERVLGKLGTLERRK